MNESARFEALDAWRGVCAILVVIFHFASVLPSALDGSMLVRNAYLFVDFFFVLSGFVLCHAYRDKVVNGAGFAQFVVRRFGRVWPLHAAVLLALLCAVAVIGALPHPQSLALTWHSNDYALNALLPNFLLLNALNLDVTGWNGPAWSIGAEFYTYLLFALLVLFVRRRLVALSIVLSLAALTFIFWRAPDLMNSTFDYGTIRCIAGFFVGVAAYHVYERLGRSSMRRATVLELAAIALVVAFVAGAGQGPDAVGVMSLAAPLVFGAAVVIFAGEEGLMSCLLRARPFRALGRYSFSIYLIHQPMLILLCYALWLAGYDGMEFHAAGALPSLGTGNLLLADFVLAVVLVAAATYRFIELPARGRIYRAAEIGPRRRRTVAATA